MYRSIYSQYEKLCFCHCMKPILPFHERGAYSGALVPRERDLVLCPCPTVSFLCEAPRASYNKSSFPRNLCTIPWNPMISPGVETSFGAKNIWEGMMPVVRRFGQAGGRFLFSMWKDCIGLSFFDFWGFRLAVWMCVFICLHFQ